MRAASNGLCGKSVGMGAGGSHYIVLLKSPRNGLAPVNILCSRLSQQGKLSACAESTCTMLTWSTVAIFLTLRKPRPRSF
jgi:hypothetical protein